MSFVLRSVVRRFLPRVGRGRDSGSDIKKGGWKGRGKGEAVEKIEEDCLVLGIQVQEEEGEERLRERERERMVVGWYVHRGKRKGTEIPQEKKTF